MKRENINSRERRHLRVRAKIVGTALRPRLSVFRSCKHVWVQLIDDQKGITLAAASDTVEQSASSRKQEAAAKLKVSSPPDRALATEAGKKTERALELGKMLAKKALSSGIREVVFDRGGYKYHGRIKALAEGARAGGLKF